MDIYLVKNSASHLVPSTPWDAEKLERFKIGDPFKAVVSKPRNGPHHRKFMALLRVVFENQERFDNLDDLLVELKIRVGHYREFITEDGRLIFLPKSISFANMEQKDFEVFYDKAVSAVIKYFIPGMTRMALDAAVNRVLEFVA